MTEYVHVQANRISASMRRVVGNDGSVVRDTCVRKTSVYSLFIAVL